MAAVATLLAPRIACAEKDDSLARVLARGELRWGADEQGGEPYVFEDRQGHLVGFEVELAAALGRALGVRAALVQNDWSTLVPALERGTFDVALNGLEVTPARAARVRFSPPYHSFDELLVARRDDTSVQGLAALMGARVGSLANSLGWELARAAGADAQSYEGVDEPLSDLETGRLRGVVLDDVILSRYLPRHPRLRVVAAVGQGQYAFAVRKEAVTLGEALDGAWKTIVADGTWQGIAQRWGLVRAESGAMLRVPEPAGPSREELAGPRLLTPHQLRLFFEGALVTLVLTLASMAVATVLGLGLALVRFEGGWLGRGAGLYVEVVRGTPLLLQLYLLYFGLAPWISLGPWTAAICGLGFNYAAYEAEIYRGALLTVPVGQWEAGAALGMSRALVYRRIVLPQALRRALPGMTNDLISLLKDSSLVSVLTVVELTKRMTIVAVDNHGWFMPGLLCAALYAGLGYPFTRLARRWEAERQRGKGASDDGHRTRPAPALD